MRGRGSFGSSAQRALLPHHTCTRHVGKALLPPPCAPEKPMQQESWEGQEDQWGGRVSAGFPAPRPGRRGKDRDQRRVWSLIKDGTGLFNTWKWPEYSTESAGRKKELRKNLTQSGGKMSPSVFTLPHPVIQNQNKTVTYRCAHLSSHVGLNALWAPPWNS